MTAPKPAVPYAQRTPDPDSFCQVFANGAWQSVPETIAVTLAKKRTKRCEDCDGEVRIHHGNSIATHTEHVHRHDGCPRSDVWRDGNTRSRHPQAIN